MALIRLVQRRRVGRTPRSWSVESNRPMDSFKSCSTAGISWRFGIRLFHFIIIIDQTLYRTGRLPRRFALTLSITSSSFCWRTSSIAARRTWISTFGKCSTTIRWRRSRNRWPTAPTNRCPSWRRTWSAWRPPACGSSTRERSSWSACCSRWSSATNSSWTISLIVMLVVRDYCVTRIRWNLVNTIENPIF